MLFITGVPSICLICNCRHTDERVTDPIHYSSTYEKDTYMSAIDINTHTADSASQFGSGSPSTAYANQLCKFALYYTGYVAL